MKKLSDITKLSIGLDTIITLHFSLSLEDGSIVDSISIQNQLFAPLEMANYCPDSKQQ